MSQEHRATTNLCVGVYEGAVRQQRAGNKNSPISHSSFLPDESLHSWSFHYVRGRSTSCILTAEESRNAEGRGLRTSIITACGWRCAVKWQRRDSFQTKSGFGGVGWVGACVVLLITNIMPLHSSMIASHFLFSSSAQNCGHRRETVFFLNV